MLQSSYTISRLKGFFRSGINYSCYEEMLNNTKRKASGSLPKDILSCLISNNTDKKSAIQGTEKLFSETAEILGEIDKFKMQAINRTPLKDLFSQLSQLFMNENINGLFVADSIYKCKKSEAVIRAEEKLVTEIRNYIPTVQAVIITPLGSGMFGSGYRLQIIDKDKKQIFSDKVLKVYRKKFFWQNFKERCLGYINNLSSEELVEKFNNERAIYKKQGITIPERTAIEIRKKIIQNIELIENIETKKVHGAMAEANISEFLRFFSGHRVTPKEGIAIPSFFGLGDTKFSLNEFIDKSMQAKKEFNYERLFLLHQDFKLQPNNVINGICIDMGGITSLLGLNKGMNILSNKQNMHGVKSIFRCTRDEKIRVLKEYKENGLFPDEILTQMKQLFNLE